MPWARFLSAEAGCRTCADHLQWNGEAARRLLPEEQGGDPAATFWAGSPGGISPGLRCDGSGESDQGEDSAQLPQLSSVACFGAARPVDQGSVEQHSVLRQLSQEPPEYERNNLAWKLSGE